MKKLILMSALALAVLPAMAMGDTFGVATVTLPKDNGFKQLVVSHATIENIVSARKQSDLQVTYDTIPVKDDRIQFPMDPVGPCRYSIDLGEKRVADFYAQPGETISVDITRLNPLNYTVGGTQLMEDMTALAAVTRPIEEQYYAIASSGSITEEQARPIMDAYDKAVKDFVASRPDSPAVPYAILDLEGVDFLDAYKNLTPEARKSIMMPFADVNLPRVEQAVAAEVQRQQMMSGDAPAPDFTLPNLAGKKVSLSDFRGKWVILDFWGSWCGWCIKGFQKLKEAYTKYNGQLEVIGIDCREPEAAWKAGVERFKLPWVNLYNGDDPALLMQYGVQGFPTKAIINPEGHLVDVTVGEDPTFYDKLAKFIGK